MTWVISFKKNYSETIFASTIIGNQYKMLKKFTATDKLLFLSAIMSLIFSEVLYFQGEKADGSFIGLWVPSILAFGIYLKLINNSQQWLSLSPISQASSPFFLEWDFIFPLSKPIRKVNNPLNWLPNVPFGGLLFYSPINNSPEELWLLSSLESTRVILEVKLHLRVYFEWATILLNSTWNA